MWRTKRAALGDLVNGAVAIRIPVTREGRMVYTVVAPLAAGAFQDVLRDQEFPAGWIATAVDQSARIVAHIPADDTAVGQLAAEIIALVEDPARAHHFSTVSAAGPSGWRVIVRAPSSSTRLRVRVAPYLLGTIGGLGTAFFLLL